jgi:four helix bundle protein
VVEGSARRGRKEFRRFLDISLGSLAELGYTLRFARDRGLLRDDWWKEVEALRNRAGQLLWRLSQTLREETG